MAPEDLPIPYSKPDLSAPGVAEDPPFRSAFVVARPKGVAAAAVSPERFAMVPASRSFVREVMRG